MKPADNGISFLIVDATDTKIQRPKEYYSGKRKTHTLKSQLIIDSKNRTIMDVACCKGSIHDFALFKQSIGIRISGQYHLFADSGYQGIIKFHKNSTIPKKKPRNGQLSEEDSPLSKYRIYIEHVNNRLKTFKILSMIYRNRRKRCTLRINLIVGIYNYKCINK